MRIPGNIVHDVSVIFIKVSPSSLLWWKSSSHEDWLKVNPFSLNLVEFEQSCIKNAELFLVILNFGLEPLRVLTLSDWQDHRHVVTDFSHQIFPFLDQCGVSAHWIVVTQLKLFLNSPCLKFIQGISDCKLPAGLRFEFPNLIGFLMQISFDQVPKQELIDRCDIFDPQKRKENAPMLLFKVFTSQTS